MPKHQTTLSFPTAGGEVTTTTNQAEDFPSLSEEDLAKLSKRGREESGFEFEEEEAEEDDPFADEQTRDATHASGGVSRLPPEMQQGADLARLEALDEELSESEFTYSAMELLPSRWRKADPKASLEKMAVQFRITSLPISIQNEIAFLREYNDRLYNLSMKRWNAEKKADIDICCDAGAWCIFDMYLFIAFRMEFSYCDFTFIKSIYTNSKEMLKGRERENYAFLRCPVRGRKMWGTLLQWMKQAIGKEDSARRAAATKQKGSASSNATQAGGANRGRGNGGGAFRGGRGSTKTL